MQVVRRQYLASEGLFVLWKYQSQKEVMTQKKRGNKKRKNVSANHMKGLKPQEKYWAGSERSVWLLMRQNVGLHHFQTNALWFFEERDWMCNKCLWNFLTLISLVNRYQSYYKPTSRDLKLSLFGVDWKERCWRQIKVVMKVAMNNSTDKYRLGLRCTHYLMCQGETQQSENTSFSDFSHNISWIFFTCSLPKAVKSPATNQQRLSLILKIHMIKIQWHHVSSASAKREAWLLVAGRVSSSSGVRCVELEQMLPL